MTVRFAFSPWRFTRDATPQEREQQQAYHDQLLATRRFTLGEGAYVSPLAGVEVDRLALGARSCIGGFAYVSHDVALGEDCVVNPYAVVRGRVRAGNAVRIASHASVVGFNHKYDDLTLPIFKQGESSRGIVIGDDVWIGANAVVVDGVTLGSHVIVAAGAVVTRDVADWLIVAGNPARPVRNRLEGGAAVDESAPRDTPESVAPQASSPAAPAVGPAVAPAAAPAAAPVAAAGTVAPRHTGDSLAASLSSFGARVAEQWPAVLARHRVDRDGARAWVDRVGGQVDDIRPLADAIEIAAMFGSLPPGSDRAALVHELQAAQDAASGMPFDPHRRPPADYPFQTLADVHTAYMVLSVGYALECLGATFAAPLRAVHGMSTERMQALMNALPWKEQAWSAGSWVDALGTAMAFNRLRFGLEEPVATLFDLLERRCQPHTGMWGQPRRADGWLQPVNGYYRLVRGTYAQFGRRLPHPDAAVDTVLAHVRLNGDFKERGANACNVLDIVHPLRELARVTAHRRDEGLACIERQVPRILGRWVDGQGFGFGSGDPPSLQGTEMWLSTVAIAADALGCGASLGYAPRGVHRLDPLVPPAR